MYVFISILYSPQLLKLNYRYDLLQLETRGVSHCGLAIYNKKKYLKAKEELWKFKYFTMWKYNLQGNPLKETQKSFKILLKLSN
jgi:hypothetical protein